MPRQVLAPATALAVPQRPRDRPAPTAAEHALTRREVEQLLATSRQAFDRLRHREDFPRPRRWLRGSPRWLAGEVQAWLEGTPVAATRAPWSWPVRSLELVRRGVVVRTHLDLERELHERLRARCFDRGETLADFIVAAVRQRLAQLERAAVTRKVVPST